MTYHTDRIRRRSGTDADLIDSLHRLDGRNYGSYKSILGDWDYGDFTLAIDHIQADPYAPPSALRIITTPQRMGLPTEALASSDARLATADFLARFASQTISAQKSRDIRIAGCGQEILQRSYATVLPDKVELRLQLQLPARGRTIMGHAAAGICDRDLPDLAIAVFDFLSDSADTRSKTEGLLAHIATYEDYCALQQILVENNWVSFVADNSVLARRNGISQLPLEDSVPFRSPESLRHSVKLPHAGTLSGMAIEPGVTVIVGGGYHGKSTLLGALQRGVYAHVPGDGREYVATVPTAMKVRAEDGRAVTSVDVSAFITHLPTGADTTNFTTQNASGSTSQAAAIVEAIELGSTTLLIDEDTSATNLLIRDSRMRALVAAEQEPITPLVDRARSFADDHGVSTIMVMGGSGDYLDVADRVLMLDHYRCIDVTERAQQVVAELPRALTPLPAPALERPRAIVKAPRPDRPKTKSSGLDTIQLDRQTVDVSGVEQIVDPGQVEAIAWCLRILTEQLADARTPLPEVLVRLKRLLQSEGLDTITKVGARQYPAFAVRPRLVDVGAALNRMRSLRVSAVDSSAEASTD